MSTSLDSTACPGSCHPTADLFPSPMELNSSNDSPQGREQDSSVLTSISESYSKVTTSTATDGMGTASCSSITTVSNNSYPKRAYLMDQCLVENYPLLEALKILGIEATVYDESAQNWCCDEIDFNNSIAVFNEFGGVLFQVLTKRYHSRVYGPPIIVETARLRESKLPITRSRYPIYCRLFKDCKIGVTGITSRDTLHSLHRYIMYMDGIYMEKEAVVTHLLANKCTGSKYRDAVALGKPILKIGWVHEVWKQRNNLKFNCDSIFEQFKLPVFHGLKIAFIGFDEPENINMIQIVNDNGGMVVSAHDATVTHIIKGFESKASDVDQSEDAYILSLTSIRSADVTLVKERFRTSPSPLKRPRFELQVINNLNEEEQYKQSEDETFPKAFVLKSEWFWSSIQIEACAEELQYIIDPPKTTAEDVVHCSGTMSFSSPLCMFSDTETPNAEGVLLSGGRRKRKRGHDIGQADSTDFSFNMTQHVESSAMPCPLNSSKVLDKTKEISDSMFSVCLKQVNDFLLKPDYNSMTSRHREFTHLLETERNYVTILINIVKNFKEPCENAEQMGGRILNVSEVREIFGDIIPIYSLHRHLLYDLAQIQRTWTEESLVGKVYCDHETEFKKAYKQFINYFEDCKLAISRAEKERPRFLAFKRIAQGRAECGKQSLSDLMIRPVQRLPSTALILDRLKKHTPEANLDYEWTAKALDVIQQANQNINEEKKRKETLHAIYELDRKIDGLPPVVVSSHRQIEAKLDVKSLTDAWGQKFDSVTLFVFNDKLMIVKRRNHPTNKNFAGVSSIGNVRSPGMGRKSIAVNSLPSHSSKPYKFLELISYENIKSVIDVAEGPPAFGFIVSEESGMRDRTILFTVPDYDPKWGNKSKLLDLFTDLTTRGGQVGHKLPLNMSNVEQETSGVLGKASKFAGKTRRKITRALSRSPYYLRRTVTDLLSNPFSGGRSQPGTASQSGSECSTTPLRNKTQT